MRLLIIEPDQILNRIYRQAFEQNGITVASVTRALDAINAVEKERPDVIVMELQIAEHNGVEFIYELRSYPEWQDIPILLHTLTPPGSLSISSEHMSKLGIGGYLYKPTTSLDGLVAEVERLALTVVK